MTGDSNTALEYKVDRLCNAINQLARPVAHVQASRNKHSDRTLPLAKPSTSFSYRPPLRASFGEAVTGTGNVKTKLPRLAKCLITKANLLAIIAQNLET